MTKEQLQQEMHMSKLLDAVEYYSKIASRKDYEPTDKERAVFGTIVAIINDMNKWF